MRECLTSIVGTRHPDLGPTILGGLVAFIDPCDVDAALASTTMDSNARLIGACDASEFRSIAGSKVFPLFVERAKTDIFLPALASTKGSLDISNLEGDFLHCRPPVQRSPENRTFLRLAGSCRRHFSARAGSFRSSAEDLKLQLLFQIFTDFFE